MSTRSAGLRRLSGPSGGFFGHGRHPAPPAGTFPTVPSPDPRAHCDRHRCRGTRRRHHRPRRDCRRPGLHRRAGRCDRCVPGRPHRGCAGRRRCGGRLRAPRGPAARRRADGDQGQRAGARRADAHRQRRDVRHAATRGPRGRAPAARCRRRRRRADPDAGTVRVRHDRLALRDHPQSVESRPHAGRLVRRRGCRRRRRHGGGRARQRRHGLDPHPCGVLRAGRDQARTGCRARGHSATARGSTWPRTARWRRRSPTARWCCRCSPATRPSPQCGARTRPHRGVDAARRCRGPRRHALEGRARTTAARAARCRPHGAPGVRRRTASRSGRPGIVRWVAGTELDARWVADRSKLQPRTRRHAATGGSRCAPGFRSRPAARAWQARAESFFADHDVLLTPALAQDPPRALAWAERGWLANVVSNARYAPFAAPWNLPAGPAIDGCPRGELGPPAVTALGIAGQLVDAPRRARPFPRCSRFRGAASGRSSCDSLGPRRAPLRAHRRALNFPACSRFRGADPRAGGEEWIPSGDPRAGGEGSPGRGEGARRRRPPR